jgi:hypothetical protein
MKKWMYLMIVGISITLIGYSVMAFANGTTGSTTKEVKGSFIALEGQSSIQLNTQEGTETIPLAKSVWVYRDQKKAVLTDLKPKDQLDLILNTKMQAAYIKASSQASVEQSTEQTPAPSAAPTPTASLAPTVSEAPPSPGMDPNASTQMNQPSTESTKAPQKEALSQEQWEKISIQAKGEGLNLHIDQHETGKGLNSKVNIHTDNQGTIHLNGQNAEQFIQQILSQVDLHAMTSKEQLMAALNKQLELNGSDIELDVDVQWKKNDSGEVEEKEDNKHIEKKDSPVTKKFDHKNEHQGKKSKDD